MAQLRVKLRVDGAGVTPTSVTLSDESATYGIRRTDTNAAIVAAGTAMTAGALGEYSYSFIDIGSPSYEYRVKVVYLTTTYYFGGIISGDTTGIISVLPSSGHYTSEAEIARLLGEFAVDLLLEDNQNTSATWSNILTDIDETISMYVGQFYDPSTLYSNNWVRRRATILGANALSGRRGNNPLYLTRTERVYDELNSIRDGRYHIPGGVPLGRFAPVVRNYTVQNVFYDHPQRVIKSKSTGTNYNNMDLAIEPFVYPYTALG